MRKIDIAIFAGLGALTALGLQIAYSGHPYLGGGLYSIGLVAACVGVYMYNKNSKH